MYVMKIGRSVADSTLQSKSAVRLPWDYRGKFSPPPPPRKGGQIKKVAEIDMSQALWFSKFSANGRVNGVKL